jgi:hypothetical protein
VKFIRAYVVVSFEVADLEIINVWGSLGVKAELALIGERLNSTQPAWISPPAKCWRCIATLLQKQLDRGRRTSFRAHGLSGQAAPPPDRRCQQSPND